MLLSTHTVTMVSSNTYLKLQNTYAISTSRRSGDSTNTNNNSSDSIRVSHRYNNSGTGNSTTHIPTVNNNSSNNTNNEMSMIESLLVPEIQAVFFWVTSACILRVAILFLVSLASLEYSSNNVNSNNDSIQQHQQQRHDSVFLTFLWEIIMTFSYIAKFITKFLLPKKVVKGLAPAFVFGSTWILFPVQRKFGPLPNIPTRIAEMILGRISMRDIALILPIHFLGAVFAAFLIRMTLSQTAVEPILYFEDDSPWAVDLCLEIFVNALYSVAVIVLPELCKLNRIPLAVVNLCLYPLFSFAVDGRGTGSAFGPNVVYALWCVSRKEEVPFRQSSHMLGPVLGGILGGMILQRVFPDD